MCRVSSFLVILGILLGAVAACAPDHEPPVNNGVDDVRHACEIRASWLHAEAVKCVNCVAAAPSPACDCEAFKEFGGLCKNQEDARRAEPSCNDANDLCSRTCAKTDCACVEGCYAQAEACKRVIAARDGCVADVCTQYCK